MGKMIINLKEDINKQVNECVTKEKNRPFPANGKLYNCKIYSIKTHDVNKFIRDITNKLKKLKETGTVEVEINISITPAPLQRLKPS